MTEQGTPKEPQPIYTLFPLSDKAIDTAGEFLKFHVEDDAVVFDNTQLAGFEIVRMNDGLQEWFKQFYYWLPFNRYGDMELYGPEMFAMQTTLKMGAAYSYRALRAEAELKNGKLPVITEIDFINFNTDYADVMHNNPTLHNERSDSDEPKKDNSFFYQAFTSDRLYKEAEKAFQGHESTLDDFASVGAGIYMLYKNKLDRRQFKEKFS